MAWQRKLLRWKSTLTPAIPMYGLHVWMRKSGLSATSIFISNHWLFNCLWRSAQGQGGGSFCSIIAHCWIQANLTHWPNGVSMLAQRLRRWPNIKTTLCRLLFAALSCYEVNVAHDVICYVELYPQLHPGYLPYGGRWWASVADRAPPLNQHRELNQCWRSVEPTWHIVDHHLTNTG